MNSTNQISSFKTSQECARSTLYTPLPNDPYNRPNTKNLRIPPCNILAIFPPQCVAPLRINIMPSIPPPPTSKTSRIMKRSVGYKLRQAIQNTEMGNTFYNSLNDKDGETIKREKGNQAPISTTTVEKHL